MRSTISLLASLAAASAAHAGALTPTYLRCEHLVNPPGIDVREPRLGWELQSNERAQKQTAYHLLVASTADNLKADRGDLWDSGEVKGDQTWDVVYAGKPLAAHQACFWKVKVWDAQGKPSDWSEPASWTIGVLDQAEWAKAEWVGYDKPRKAIPTPEAPFDGAKWIAFSGDPKLDAPKGNRVYLTTFELPKDAKVESAELIVTGDDKVWFVLNGEQVTRGEGYDKPKSVDVAGKVKPGVNHVRAQIENTSKGPTGLLAKFMIKLADGKTVTVVTDETWHCTDKPGANWHNRDIKADEWPKAVVVGAYGDKPWGKLKYPKLVLPPPAHMRTAFTAKAPKRATLYVTGLGIFDVHLNGKRVSDDWFNPGWTDYTKRVYYRAYDVTDRIRDGDNALGAVLADGWYSGYVGYGKMRDHYGQRPRFKAILRLELADGSTQLVTTGPNWKAATGPISEADFLMGEAYDARKELPGWDAAGFDDKKWDKVDSGAELKPVVQWHPAQPVRAIAEFKARTITEPKPGVYVLDLGQNFAGVPRLKVTGDAGQVITLRFAERLNPDGTVYTTNLREARCTDTYVCRGGGPEEWQPRFTFHGFQYVEVSGLKQKPTPAAVVGVALSSDTPVVGSFECSDPALNRLFQNIYWTQRMNFIDIPTDCPQRDERLGWTGDAQVYVTTASYICDVQPFFTKWLVDLADAQRADGQFPMVAPLKVAGDDGGPAWADAGVVCPYVIYSIYHDRRLLERQYPSMVKFVEFCRKRSTPELLPPKQYHAFGDWLSINANTPKDIIYMAYFAQSTRLLSASAHGVDNATDATKYRDLYNEIRKAFQKRYVKADGRIDGDTQACYVLALAADLLDGEAKTKAAEYLVDNIKKRGWRLSTGFIGTKDLMLVLNKIGRQDVAYRLLHNETFPSWKFSINHGATSIWERWDGWTPEKGFQDPGMNSFAHYSFGAVYGWMFQTIGGIWPVYMVGNQKIQIAPVPDAKLTHATVKYRGFRGQIASSWKRDGDTFTLTLEVPPNVEAEVRVPTSDPDSVKVDGGDTGVRWEAPGPEPYRGVTVASGKYTFTAKAPKPVELKE
ncbi:MAG TPA: family 78 glycoside hydrolase catalytic domain [Gemmataceae bacterium]|nr:family 78 glycoside hydrolase catalytic domain [Gemmataceae bacterium]